MMDTPYIAEVAALIGNPARANMLLALKDDGVLSATELAHVAGLAPNTASGHLARLTEAQIVTVERKGRHRYYCLAGDAVADALEALEALATRSAPRYRPPNPRDHAIRFARTCYDHLAGTLGVRLTWSLVSCGYMKTTESNFLLTKEGERAFKSLGIEVDLLRAGRRQLARRCPDWSEKRPHLGGALGASLFASLCELGWLRPQKGSRVVSVTRQGRTALRDHFQIEL